MDQAELQQYVGRKQTEEDLATAYPVRALAATLGRDEPPPEAGSPVPPGWHGLYFLATAPRDALGRDGLPDETGIMPPLPFPRRMFAGQRMTFHQPIRVGDRITKESELTDLTLKDGSTGKLVFATLTIRISGSDGLCLEEEYDRVFREDVAEGAKNPAPRREPPPDDCPWKVVVEPDPVMLFRYSALTFNPHRIHYDRPYAMEVEGYPGLVVHGPLSLTLLADFARDNNPGKRMTGFHMRARAPLFDTAPFELVGRPSDDGSTCELWAVTPEGTVAMSAGASFT
jgi:3-methylfumaryl-CoA hydratase